MTYYLIKNDNGNNIFAMVCLFILVQIQQFVIKYPIAIVDALNNAFVMQTIPFYVNEHHCVLLFVD